MSRLRPYIAIARIDNWSKNLAMLAGTGLALVFADTNVALPWRTSLLAMVALCLASSANYTINEYVDVRFDQFHPIKRQRAGVQTHLHPGVVALQYLLLAVTATVAAALAAPSILTVILIYLACAWLYNLPPVRIKDLPYGDVLLESVNYPFRILIGWFCALPTVLPPSSILLVAWSVGAFMMCVKRLAEFQIFADPAQAAAYRKSYRHYNVKRLMLAAFLYAMLAAFATAVFLLKYRIEFIVVMPFISAWFVGYLSLGFQSSQTVIYPERLLRQPGLMVLSLTILVLLVVLARVDIPGLHLLSQPLRF